MESLRRFWRHKSRRTNCPGTITFSARTQSEYYTLDTVSPGLSYNYDMILHVLGEHVCQHRDSFENSLEFSYSPFIIPFIIIQFIYSVFAVYEEILFQTYIVKQKNINITYDEECNCLSFINSDNFLSSLALQWWSWKHCDGRENIILCTDCLVALQ